MRREYPFRVGITGGIGSGKSVVCKLFAMLGVSVYDSDARAKRLMVSDRLLVDSIRERFGEESYCDGVLNRAFLAHRVFGDRSELDALNGLVHPAVIRDFRQWAARSESDYLIVESAILYESGLDGETDAVVAVSAPQELRANRAALRDGTTPQQVITRMYSQMSDAQREALADFVIYNDERHLVWKQVLSLHETFSGGLAGRGPVSGKRGDYPTV